MKILFAYTRMGEVFVDKSCKFVRIKSFSVHIIKVICVVFCLMLFSQNFTSAEGLSCNSFEDYYRYVSNNKMHPIMKFIPNFKYKYHMMSPDMEKKYDHSLKKFSQLTGVPLERVENDSTVDIIVAEDGLNNDQLEYISNLLHEKHSHFTKDQLEELFQSLKKYKYRFAYLSSNFKIYYCLIIHTEIPIGFTVEHLATVDVISALLPGATQFKNPCRGSIFYTEGINKGDLSPYDIRYIQTILSPALPAGMNWHVFEELAGIESLNR